MSLYVVDASVGVKWLVQEIYSTEAARLQAPTNELHVPTFFDVEVGNVFWKKVNRGELTYAEAVAALSLLPTVPVSRHADGPLVLSAFDLAHQTKRPVYDCMYLALALQLKGKMVTADDRFFNSLAGTQWAASVMRVQDVQ